MEQYYKEMKILKTKTECDERGKDLGQILTAMGCGNAAQKEESDCDQFMYSHSYPVLGCFCCPSTKQTTSNSNWYIYKTCVKTDGDGNCVPFQDESLDY